MREIKNKRNLQWFGFLDLVHSSRTIREFSISILISDQDPTFTPLNENLVKIQQNPQLVLLTTREACTLKGNEYYNSKLFLSLPNTQLSKWIFGGQGMKICYGLNEMWETLLKLFQSMSMECRVLLQMCVKRWEFIGQRVVLNVGLTTIRSGPTASHSVDQMTHSCSQ